MEQGVCVREGERACESVDSLSSVAYNSRISPTANGDVRSNAPGPRARARRAARGPALAPLSGNRRSATRTTYTG